MVLRMSPAGRRDLPGGPLISKIAQWRGTDREVVRRAGEAESVLICEEVR
jgi:hypothetical protein